MPLHFSATLIIFPSLIVNGSIPVAEPLQNSSCMATYIPSHKPSKYDVAQLARAAEYIDCSSAEL